MDSRITITAILDSVNHSAQLPDKLVVNQCLSWIISPFFHHCSYSSSSSSFLPISASISGDTVCYVLLYLLVSLQQFYTFEMSAYGHLMEREHSSRSLSSRAGSEMGSRYYLESGIYMSSFAATNFVAALVIFGVLLMTLLVALTVMLQSCERKSAGIVELWKSTDDYSYCKMFAQNAELNGLEANSLPAICKDVSVKYIKEGQYMRDLNNTFSIIENYFNGVTPLPDNHATVLMDIDDFLPSDSVGADSLLLRSDHYICNNCIREATLLKRNILQKIYIKVQSGGWPLILLSRRPEILRNVTMEKLISAGCSGWSSLVMRLDDEMKMDSREYFSRKRDVLETQGLHIKAMISSQMDALAGTRLGTNVFKLPNPIYYNKHHYTPK